MEARKYDVAVLGATGVVGRLMSEYLCFLRSSKLKDLKFVLAARSTSKLESLRGDLSSSFKIPADSIDIKTVDTTDLPSLINLCKETRVLATTVGPFLLYGEPVVKACIEAKTHYCDITGEMPFVALINEKYGAAAKAAKIKLVSFCGFDSVPSDISTFLLEEKAIELTGSPCSSVTMGVTSIKGGISGSTIASGLNLVGHKNLHDPYYLCKSALPSSSIIDQLAAQPRVPFTHKNEDLGYGAFFIMSRVNENVVRWSNCLQNWRYGKNFQYCEMLACRYNRFTAFLTAAVTYLSVLFIAFPFTRWIGQRLKLIPLPGEGPSRYVLNNGHFRCDAVGRVTKKDNTVSVIRSIVSSDFGDPGYKETAKMLVECALTIAFDLEECPAIYGSVSPAAGLGFALVQRLNEAGIKCRVEVYDAPQN